MGKEQLINNYLRIKITYSWYKNAKIDYNINGKFIKATIKDNDLIIYHEEEGQEFKTIINYYNEYNLEQLYNIWMEEDWELAA